jgi:uncharacterized phiE125 gp8 family phage protein
MPFVFGTTPDVPPSSAIWTIHQLAYHLRLDPDDSDSALERDYVLELQAAAVEFAETAMGCSLLTRTVTAVFYGPNTPTNFGYTYAFNWRHRLRLPRGPILGGITSVTDANGTVDPSKYKLEAAGVSDLLRVDVGYVEPLTVVYQGGYGSRPCDVPADIRHAIRMHVGTLYSNRQSIGKAGDSVPHGLADFYRLKCRMVPIG